MGNTCETMTMYIRFTEIAIEAKSIIVTVKGEGLKPSIEGG